MYHLGLNTASSFVPAFLLMVIVYLRIEIETMNLGKTSEGTWDVLERGGENEKVAYL